MILYREIKFLIDKLLKKLSFLLYHENKKMYLIPIKYILYFNFFKISIISNNVSIFSDGI